MSSSRGKTNQTFQLQKSLSAPLPAVLDLDFAKTFFVHSKYNLFLTVSAALLEVLLQKMKSQSLCAYQRQFENISKFETSAVALGL